jgi:Cu+-exporting ATPase
MSAQMVPRLAEVLRFAKSAVGVVRLSFLISALYNVVGISLAARGLMSPVICAILMPVSSVTVVAVGCGLTRRLGRGLECGENAQEEGQA